MASRSTYDAGAAALDFFAQFMMNRQAKKEERAARQEERTEYERALEEREKRAEERAARRRETTPVSRKVYQGDASAGPPELMVEELNDYGASIRSVPASQREKQDFASGQQASALALSQEREKQRKADEDRSLVNNDREERRKIAERNAAANELRASRTGQKSEPDKERPLSRKEALERISALQYRAAEGQSARDVAKRDGIDYDYLLEAANQGAPKKQGVIGRAADAIGGAFSNAFKKPPVLGKPDKKAGPPVPGAKKAPDGKWYVQQNGKWMLVEE